MWFPEILDDYSELKISDSCVFSVILSLSKSKFEKCCGLKFVSNEVHMSRRNVQRSIEKLVEVGLVESTKISTGKQTEYRAVVDYPSRNLIAYKNVGYDKMSHGANTDEMGISLETKDSVVTKCPMENENLEKNEPSMTKCHMTSDKMSHEVVTKCPMGSDKMSHVQGTKMYANNYNNIIKYIIKDIINIKSIKSLKLLKALKSIKTYDFFYSPFLDENQNRLKKLEQYVFSENPDLYGYRKLAMEIDEEIKQKRIDDFFGDYKPTDDLCTDAQEGVTDGQTGIFETIRND